MGSSHSIDTVLFDFGGVLAEEGFRDGLAAIGRLNGRPGEDLIRLGHELVHRIGYVTGRVPEKRWWDALRAEAAIGGTDETLRREILERFTLRPWMLELAAQLRLGGLTVGILSDQTNWLDEIDGRTGLYGRFDYVFNSYHMGKAKTDPGHFDDVLKLLNRRGTEVLFVDDLAGHVGRASQRGWNAILYRRREEFLQEMSRAIPGIA